MAALLKILQVLRALLVLVYQLQPEEDNFYIKTVRKVSIMDGSYSSDLKLRRLLLKKIARKNKKYRYGVLISATLYIIAALILLSSFVLLFKHPTTSMGIFVFICIGIIFAIIPFLLLFQLIIPINISVHCLIVVWQMKNY